MSIAFLLSGVAANAEHAAVAYADEYAWGGWSVRSTQKDADAQALKECNASNPGKICSVRNLVAFSYAQGQGRYGISLSEKSKSAAEREALKNCNAPDCKIIDTETQPGFFVIYAPMKNGNTSGVHAYFGSATGAAAMEEGKRSCEKTNSKPCEFQFLGAIKCRSSDLI